MDQWYGGIEAGGTKFVCVIGKNPDEIIAESRFPTTTPEETLERALTFFQEHVSTYPIGGIGIGSFGPVDLDPNSPTYGAITTTPKPGWKNTVLAGWFERKLGVPVAFDTDVNVAALGEYTWGAAQELQNILYITIGTGIGGGALINGEPLHGLVHPEMGHIAMPHDWQTDPFPGACPYHGDCFEGVAAGPAILKRWGVPGQELPPDHPAWKIEAGYISAALMSLICTLSPQRIILGGGVMEQPAVLPMVQERTLQALNGYIQSAEILEHIDRYIVTPGLGNRSGMLGAIALIRRKLE